MPISHGLRAAPPQPEPRETEGADRDPAALDECRGKIEGLDEADEHAGRRGEIECRIAVAVAREPAEVEQEIRAHVEGEAREPDHSGDADRHLGYLRVRGLRAPAKSSVSARAQSR